MARRQEARLGHRQRLLRPVLRGALRAANGELLERAAEPADIGVRPHVGRRRRQHVALVVQDLEVHARGDLRGQELLEVVQGCDLHRLPLLHAHPGLGGRDAHGQDEVGGDADGGQDLRDRVLLRQRGEARAGRAGGAWRHGWWGRPRRAPAGSTSGASDRCLGLLLNPSAARRPVRDAGGGHRLAQAPATSGGAQSHEQLGARAQEPVDDLQPHRERIIVVLVPSRDRGMPVANRHGVLARVQNGVHARYISGHPAVDQLLVPLPSGLLDRSNLLWAGLLLPPCDGALQLFVFVVLFDLAVVHLESEFQGLTIVVLVRAPRNVDQALRRIVGSLARLLLLQRLQPLTLLADEAEQVLQRQLPRSLVQDEGRGLRIEARGRHLDALQRALPLLGWEVRVLRLQGPSALPLLQFLHGGRHALLPLLGGLDLELGLRCSHDLVPEKVGGAGADDGHRHRVEVELRDVELELRARCPMPGGHEGDHDLGGAVGRDDPLQWRDDEVGMALQLRDLILELDGDLAGERDGLRLLGPDGHLAEVDDSRQLDVIRRGVRVDGHDQVLALISTKDLDRVVVVAPLMRRERHGQVLAHAGSQEAFLVEADLEPWRRGANDRHAQGRRRGIEDPKQVRMLLVDAEPAEVQRLRLRLDDLIAVEQLEGALLQERMRRRLPKRRGQRVAMLCRRHRLAWP
mmetsp:Transcript_91293/g.263437  ORF Transcript_91293/g.263437 Transcript_91293/m.263437 type:complete len:688 (-) Transcript_91293:99-2162(-)